MKRYVAHEQIGYYCHDVVVFVDERLARMPYAQAGWVKSSCGNVTAWDFISYSSDIFRLTVKECEDNVLVFGFVPGKEYSDHYAAIDCSRTTSRQATAALRELSDVYGIPETIISDVRECLKRCESKVFFES